MVNINKYRTRSYNVNLKILSKVLPDDQALSTICNWSCNGPITENLNHAGSIEINDVGLNTFRLVQNTPIRFQIRQQVVHSVVIQSIIIKHVKTI